ncbi:DUF3592 domain-containing protein [Kitasatospora sp. NPDC004615]|uniref:DUF3592 domain-containing protein n=1 Tax=unclassified Kitasatospora TaxID=2633591 RepID=UPI0036BCBBD2
MTDYGPTVAGIVFSLFVVATGVAAGIGTAWQADRARRTLAEGLLAEAVVLVVFTSESAGGVGENRSTTTTRHTILGFRTPDGSEVRVDERDGHRRAVGDRVAVRYLPERPDRAVAVDRSAVQDTFGIVMSILLTVGGIIGLVITLAHMPSDPPTPGVWSP